MLKLKNSFLYDNLDGIKVLIVVPHQDDEINLSGSMINFFKRAGANVKVLYTTNGDFFYSANTRIEEAIRALGILGVDEKDIFFLGYNDTPSTSNGKHIFSGDSNPIISEAGYNHTYGRDYAFIKYGKHSLYTRKNYTQDLKNFILDIRADIIFSVDYDIHPDHRALSLTFDEVIGDILKETDYVPIIYKGFAYVTSYEAEEDFYQINLKSTLKPRYGTVYNYFGVDDIIDNSIYQWNNRIRFPINDECRKMFLRKNKIFKALLAHKSQYAAMRAGRIINGDSVFWERRTDSISYKADIIVSSNDKDAYRLNDFMILNSKDIFTDKPMLNEYLWVPNNNDNIKEAKFVWEDKQTVRLIKIYSNIRDGSNIEELQVTFDTGEELVVGPFKDNGEPISIELPKKVYIKECTLKILNYVGENPGIAECEFYASVEHNKILPPILKVTVDGDFVYDYYIDSDVECLKLDLYTFGNVSKQIEFKVDPKNYSFIKNNMLNIDPRDKKIYIKAYDLSDRKIYDEIMIIRLSGKELQGIKRKLFIDKLYTKIICKIQRRIFRWKKKIVKV